MSARIIRLCAALVVLIVLSAGAASANASPSPCPSPTAAAAGEGSANYYSVIQTLIWAGMWVVIAIIAAITLWKLAESARPRPL